MLDLHLNPIVRAQIYASVSGAQQSFLLTFSRLHSLSSLTELFRAPHPSVPIPNTTHQLLFTKAELVIVKDSCDLGKKHGQWLLYVD